MRCLETKCLRLRCSRGSGDSGAFWSLDGPACSHEIEQSDLAWTSFDDCVACHPYDFASQYYLSGFPDQRATSTA